jgi:regulator of chromosome condensation
MAQVKYIKNQAGTAKTNKANTAKKVVQPETATKKRKTKEETDATEEPTTKKRATKAKGEHALPTIQTDIASIHGRPIVTLELILTILAAAEGALPKKASTKTAAKETTAKAPAKKAAPKATSKTTTETSAKTTKAAAKPATKAAAKPAAAKKAAPKKAATKDAAKSEAPEEKAEAKPAASRKRKATEEVSAPPAKKVKALVKGPVIGQAPTQRLHIYVFGEGSAGELGLGTAKNAIDVKRPRLNANLSADKVGIVQIAAGGMHCIALTHDNKILTWGVNDQGTLGRNTDWDGGVRDIDAAEEDSDDDDDDSGLNPHESTPAEVDWSSTEVAPDTKFVKVAAGDSTSFALTDDGRVYGWGCFRSNDGIFGLTPDVKVATRPVLISDLKNVVDIKAGANHALALDSKGAVYAWGSGQQNQLGRRIVERTKTEGLRPREFGLPKSATKRIVSIETGSYHSFAISKNGDTYAWGLNNFGQTGITDDAGQDEAAIMRPQIIEAFQGQKVISIKGGEKHSLAATEDGSCFVWGRMDGHQMGIADADLAKLPEDILIKDADGKGRIIAIPQKVVAIDGAVVHVASNSDHCLAVTKEGKAWSWGFSTNYQTGQGQDEDVVVATLIDNTAVREKKLNGATTGGQFSVLTAPADA